MQTSSNYLIELPENAQMLPCLGAIIGDTVGSIYEFDNIKTTEFPLFDIQSHFTDDSVMTIAVAEWCTTKERTEQQLIDIILKWANKYPAAGYGGGFYTWLFEPEYLRNYDGIRIGHRTPYYSWGNGSAMRVSACGWVARTIDEAIDLGRRSAGITHNHPEGLRGAEATAAAIFLARQGADKDEIRDFIEQRFYYYLHHDCDDIHNKYQWDESCQGTVPPAIIAFLDSYDFESAIRLAVSLGGDSDTLACITGSIAQAYYKEIPDHILTPLLTRLPTEFWQLMIQLKENITGSYNLNRFVVAQESYYKTALQEICNGKKDSHWIWFIFPQMKDLGHSPMSQNYGITSLDEARAYIVHPLLRKHLFEITQALLKHKDKTAFEILGTIDAIKVRSCMTLFDLVEPNTIFAEVLNQFYNGERDEKTLDILSNPK